MKRKIIVERGKLGSDGLIIDVKGLKIKNPVNITLQFNPIKPMGKAILTKRNGIVYAEMEVNPEFIGLFPVLCIKSYERNDAVVVKSECFALCLSGNPNADSNIKPL
jgi:hypothetical protein